MVGNSVRLGVTRVPTAPDPIDLLDHGNTVIVVITRYQDIP